jgi:Zn-dependent peptidase ImmA (M78 family)/DNA-binding XRE family transcriptional regulator
MSEDPRQLLLPGAEDGTASTAVKRLFSPNRLTQARLVAGLTKAALADRVGVSAAAIGQFEAGITRPRPEQLQRMSEELEFPVAFFTAGRPYEHMDASMAHFKSLRSTRVGERARATAYVEQVWELTHALEKHVDLPPVSLPDAQTDPIEAARVLRAHWQIPRGPFPYLVRTMEVHGVVAMWLPVSKEEGARIEAFSTSKLSRPIVVLTPDRADDIYRHRFAAAHELGHLLLHHDVAPGDIQQEKEADSFAAELLTPREEIRAEIGHRVRLADLADVGRRWGVSIKSLIKRTQEMGLVSEATARRNYQRHAQLVSSGLLPAEPVSGYPGELPSLLTQAFSLAEQHGLSMADLADELRWPTPHLRMLLGQQTERPRLRLV